MVSSLSVSLVTETYLPEVNGVAMTLGHLATGLSARGHRLMIVRPRQKHEKVGRLADDQLLTPGIPLPGYGELRFGLPARRTLQQLWTDEPPDVVHIATEGPLGLSALAAARALDIPVISSFHTNFHAYCQHYGIGWMHGGIERYLRWFHNRTQATLVPTTALAADLTRQDFCNIGVLSRGVDMGHFNPARRSAALRASWGASDADPVILVVGRIAAEKNLALAIRAFSAIRALKPQALMIFVGDGPRRHALACKHPECRFVGVRHGEELARHYASADLLLFPSLTETFGNVVSEALASGLPTIAFDYAAAGNLIKNHVNGLKVPPGDDAAFITAAVQLASMPERLTAMRTACPASVGGLDWENIHDSFEKLIDEIVTRHDQAPPAPHFSLW